MFPGARDELMSADLRVMQGDSTPGIVARPGLERAPVVAQPTGLAAPVG